MKITDAQELAEKIADQWTDKIGMSVLDYEDGFWWQWQDIGHGATSWVSYPEMKVFEAVDNAFDGDDEEGQLVLEALKVEVHRRKLTWDNRFSEIVFHAMA